MENKLNKTPIIADKTLIFTTLMLVIFGIFMIYSASNYNALQHYNDSFFYVKKQTLSFVVGIIFIVATSFLSLDALKKISLPLYIVSVLLLALVFAPIIGVENYGAKRWLNLGITTIQPSEIAKFAMVFLLAKVLDTCDVTKFKGFLFSILTVGVVCCLIIIEPNMSITVCVAMVAFVMLIVGGARKKYLICLIIPVLIALPILIIAEPYRIKRMMAFVNPWLSPQAEGYQLIQSYYALGSGGLFGVGYLNSRQKFLFLPFSESDFIFSVIGEELGLFGCIFTLLLFLIIIWRGISIAIKCQSRFGCYCAVGIVAIIAIQTMLNIAVVSGSIPPTGLPLPFISAGGSSLVVFMASVGILEKIAKLNYINSHNILSNHNI
ncbi:MAG: putative lipid II flippase FtsW [Clostridia bacterium]